MGFLRLLIFLYTQTLPDGSDGALLEDLMAADRYGIAEMKAMCVHMLVPSRTNWLDLLRAADLLQLPVLHDQVVYWLRDHFDVLEGHHGELREEFPDLLEKLLLSRSPFYPPPPSEQLIKLTQDSKLADLNLSLIHI